MADLFVYEFRSTNQLYLLGYTVDDEVCLVYLEAVGPHENFYRGIKRAYACWRRRAAAQTGNPVRRARPGSFSALQDNTQ